MIKFKLIDNRTSVSKRIKELEQKLEEFPKEFMRITADVIIKNSPVDTKEFFKRIVLIFTRFYKES